MLSPDIHLLGTNSEGNPIFIRFDCTAFKVYGADKKNVIGNGWNFFKNPTMPIVKVEQGDILACMVARTKNKNGNLNLEDVKISLGSNKVLAVFHKRLEEFSISPKKVRLPKKYHR